jgi:hypothetical protein
LWFDTLGVSDAYDGYGSVSGFLPQNWCLCFERLILLFSWFLRSIFRAIHLWIALFFLIFALEIFL